MREERGERREGGREERRGEGCLVRGLAYIHYITYPALLNYRGLLLCRYVKPSLPGSIVMSARSTFSKVSSKSNNVKRTHHQNFVIDF